MRKRQEVKAEKRNNASSTNYNDYSAYNLSSSDNNEL